MKNEGASFNSVWSRVTQSRSGGEAGGDIAYMQALISAEQSQAAFYRFARDAVRGEAAALFGLLLRSCSRRLSLLRALLFLSGGAPVQTAAQPVLPAPALTLLRQAYILESAAAERYGSAAMTADDPRLSASAFGFSQQAAENADRIVAMLEKIL